MNKQWDLSPLYKGFDDPQFAADMEAMVQRSNIFRQLVAELKKDGATEATQLTRVLKVEEELNELAYRLYAFAALRGTVNTSDGEAVTAQAKVQKLLSDTSGAQAALNDFIGSVASLDAVIADSAFLQEYRFLLHERKQQAKYALDEKVEEALAKMNLSGGAAWEKLQAYLTSTVEADYRGEKLNLSAVRNLAYDADPAARKAAYEAELACYDKVKDGVCFALNNLKLQVNTECELRKADSPLEMTLRQSRMQKATLDAMIAAIEEALPVFWKYLKAKAKVLGYEGGLKWWDLFAPMGENNATYTTEEAKAYLLNHFRPFAPDIAALMEQAFDESWIDFYPHNGKVGGAFCENLPPIKQSRVLTNFDGSFSSIVTLAHELGHAYHGAQIQDHRPLSWDYSMPVAETASTFNETVVMEAAIREAADPKVKLGLLESQLQDITQIMCDIMSRYWFETAMFQKAEGGFAFPDELCEMMHEAQVRAYGDGIDPDTLHPYMWLCKSHYYSSGLSFYNFPYAFGGLFAVGLYAKYLEEGESFLPKYRALLKATTVSSVEDVAKLAGIDLSDASFWRSSLAIFENRVNEFLSLVNAFELG